MNLLKCIIFIKTTCIYICFMYSLEKLINIEKYIKKKKPCHATNKNIELQRTQEGQPASGSVECQFTHQSLQNPEDTLTAA